MSGAPTFEVLTREIVRAEAAGAVGMVTLLRALRDGRIAFLQVSSVTSAGTFKRWAAVTRDQPAIVVIGDDDYQDRGPAGFRVAKRAIEWCASALLHASGAEGSHYAAAIDAAQIVKRVLIVECSSATLPGWTVIVRAAPQIRTSLTILPRDGAHPRLPARGALQ